MVNPKPGKPILNYLSIREVYNCGLNLIRMNGFLCHHFLVRKSSLLRPRPLRLLRPRPLLVAKPPSPFGIKLCQTFTAVGKGGGVKISPVQYDMICSSPLTCSRTDRRGRKTLVLHRCAKPPHADTASITIINTNLP